ncbi:MAG: hypothetical protein HQ494_02250 [Rhodospirillales bacterium]|nr:hypothetical protein [Rhodospirillales bacterium]
MSSSNFPARGSVLGLHVIGNTTSAALFNDGELVAAVAEERLVRQRRSRAFPRQAIDHCLKSSGMLSLDDIDQIVVAWNPGIQMRRINMSGFTQWRRYDPEWLYIVPNNLADMYSGWDDEKDEAMSVGFGLDNDKRITYLKHHNAHAGWAYASPFEEAAVAVFDEHGESVSVSLGVIRGNRPEVLRELPVNHSLGLFYATFTEFLGFTPNADEWKVMGAAAYGDPLRFIEKIRSIVKYGGDSLFLDQHHFEFHNMRFGGYFTETLSRHLGMSSRDPDGPLTQDHHDLAASVQMVFEDMMVGLLNWLHAQVKIPRLVLNGGCCMNSVACGKVIANTPFKEIFVSPAPADPGTCIGGPLWLYGSMNRDGGLFRTVVTPYTGPVFNDEEIRRTLERCKLGFRQCDDILDEVADRLVQGKVVGWFQGRMEFGDRALGNRSILADPRDPGMKDRINRSVKYREQFRPLAPSVLNEEAREYFKLPDGAEVNYMEQVYQVREDKRALIPSVVHSDGSSRLHTVRSEDNPLFHSLLTRFKDKTGVPVLLNTSFNINGEPIVASPEDALRTFISSGIDVLAIGNFLVEKEGVSVEGGRT